MQRLLKSNEKNNQDLGARKLARRVNMYQPMEINWHPAGTSPEELMCSFANSAYHNMKEHNNKNKKSYSGSMVVAYRGDERRGAEIAKAIEECAKQYGRRKMNIEYKLKMKQANLFDKVKLVYHYGFGKIPNLSVLLLQLGNNEGDFTSLSDETPNGEGMNINILGHGGAGSHTVQSDWEKTGPKLNVKTKQSYRTEEIAEAIAKGLRLLSSSKVTVHKIRLVNCCSGLMGELKGNGNERAIERYSLSRYLAYLLRDCKPLYGTTVIGYTGLYYEPDVGGVPTVGKFQPNENGGVDFIHLPRSSCKDEWVIGDPRVTLAPPATGESAIRMVNQNVAEQFSPVPGRNSRSPGQR